MPAAASSPLVTVHAVTGRTVENEAHVLATLPQSVGLTPVMPVNAMACVRSAQATLLSHDVRAQGKMCMVMVHRTARPGR